MPFVCIFFISMKNRLVLIIFLKKNTQLYWAFVFLILDRNMSTKIYFSTIMGKRFRQYWGLTGNGRDWNRLRSMSFDLNECYLDPQDCCHNWRQRGIWVLHGQISQGSQRCQTTGFFFFFLRICCLHYFLDFFLLFILFFIFGCAGSLWLRVGFL